MSKSSLLILLCIAAVAGFAYYAFSGYHEVAKESERFAVDSITAISEDWNPKVFVARADPGLIKSMNAHGGVAVLFAAYPALGKLKGPADCELMNTTTLVVKSEKYAAATYHCHAAYDAGPMRVAITVRKGETHPSWEIYYMKIEPEPSMVQP